MMLCRCLLLTPTSPNGAAQIVATSVQRQVSNTSTSYDYSCTINPQEVSDFEVHASGDCSLAANETFSVPIQSTSGGTSSTTSTTATSSTTAVGSTTTVVTSSATACAAAVAFPVLETTTYGQTVLVAGNITQLGIWNTDKAVALNANQYTSSRHLWNGTVAIPAGTAFEYKYILRGTRGGISWESGANRVYRVPSSACGSVAAGSNPDSWRQ